MARVALAFLFVPMLAVLLGGAALSLGINGHVGTELFVIAGPIAGIFVYPTVVVFGIPAFFIMVRRNWLSIQACFLVALLCAVIAWLLVMYPFDETLLGSNGASYGLFGLVCAIFGTLLFWVIGIRNNAALTRLCTGAPRASGEL